MIRRMGFVDYFLIVSDFIGYAKAQHIPVGPGRGSAAGSVVSYCLGITDVDPVQYNLYFERFLNPERVSMPDIDVDFCVQRRGEVIDYVIRKYGADHVAQIVTFGTMAARSGHPRRRQGHEHYLCRGGRRGQGHPPAASTPRSTRRCSSRRRCARCMTATTGCTSSSTRPAPSRGCRGTRPRTRRAWSHGAAGRTPTCRWRATTAHSCASFR